MRLEAGKACTKLALLTGSRAASRAANSNNLLWCGFHQRNNPPIQRSKDGQYWTFLAAQYFSSTCPQGMLTFLRCGHVTLRNQAITLKFQIPSIRFSALRSISHSLAQRHGKKRKGN